jgi:multidrug efflux pump subunit AcrA (membrane-fusion protein)
MSDLHARQLLRLTGVLQLETRARAASADELAFVMVNETLGVVRYRQALLWRSAPLNRIVAVSGVAMPDPQAPFVVWASRLCRELEDRTFAAMRELTADDVTQKLRAEWSEWLPPYLVWIPLPPALGALVLAREEPLGEAERALLVFLADAYAHAWQVRLGRQSFRERAHAAAWKRVAAAAAAVLLLAVAFVPVRQSVLAPAEIMPRAPAVIRAPLDGVVDSVFVKPNEAVTEGQALFALDPRRLRNQLEVALRAQEAADTELRQAKQFAVVDTKVRASLPGLQGKLDQLKAEVAYLKDQLERIDVRAPRAGLAVFDDPNDWLGRPVAIGERVMLVADAEKVEIEARLPVADAIDLDIGGPVRLFLNIDPQRPRVAVLTFVSYQAQRGVDGTLAYRVKARLAEDEALPRIGLKGTAKLYGAEVPLAYAIFRRPMSAVRQWLGF